KTLPFIVNKAEWGFNNSAGVPYTARLMRRENEPVDYSGQWVFAETVQFYQLWSDVKGTRVDSRADDLDILVDAYVDGNKAYVIVNNLEFSPKNLHLDIKGVSAEPTNIEIRHSYLEGPKVTGVPRLDISQLNMLPDAVEIGAEGTYIFTYTFAEEVAIDKNSEERKYYADTYLKEIAPNAPMTFKIDNIEKGTFGEATLRVGVGRDHGKTIRPTISFNGQEIQVPNNHRGGPQTDRDNFFGVLEIPVSYDLLRTNNEIKVTYPDQGGYVSTVTLQAFTFSDNIRGQTVSTNEAGQRDDFFAVFPNPARKAINVTSSDAIESILIIDMAGRIVKKAKSGSGIEISDLPLGSYLIRVKGDKYTGVAKFIKKD
ncbi:MAG: T9SS type A sorting domain-containing protein, partial [Bacteroidota bacterium]